MFVTLSYEGIVNLALLYVRSNIHFQLRADLSPNNLERLAVEITNPRSKAFAVSTWYWQTTTIFSWPLFNLWESIDKIDAENLELKKRSPSRLISCDSSGIQLVIPPVQKWIKQRLIGTLNPLKTRSMLLEWRQTRLMPLEVGTSPTFLLEKLLGWSAISALW